MDIHINRTTTEVESEKAVYFTSQVLKSPRELADLQLIYRAEDSKVVSTQLWNTPRATFTKRLKRDFFHDWQGGLPGVCSKGVLKQP